MSKSVIAASLVTGRESVISWRCHPDLNWGMTVLQTSDPAQAPQDLAEGTQVGSQHEAKRGETPRASRRRHEAPTAVYHRILQIVVEPTRAWAEVRQVRGDSEDQALATMLSLWIPGGFQ